MVSSSFDEWTASLRQRLASGAARTKAAAAPPDPRRPTVSVQLAAAGASLAERIAAHRGRVAVPNPALDTARSLAEQIISRQEQLKALKNQNRDLELQLQQTLSFKAHKESEYTRVTESISNTAVMNEKLKMSLVELGNKRDTCAAIISDQFQDLETREAKANEDATFGENLEQALSWFNKFVGLQVIVGEKGVKFVYGKIDPQRPEKECSLCIKIDDDTYNLFQWDPPIKDFEELVNDLNLSGDLLKFLKVAREKFQSAFVKDVPSVPFSPPVMTTANHTSEDVPDQSNSESRNKRLPAKRRSMTPSPGIVRRSPRLEVCRQQEK